MKIFTKFIAIAICALTATTTLGLAPAYSANNPCSDVCTCDGVADSVREAAGCGNNTSKDGLPNAVIAIINVIISISGILAVLFIIVGGVQYMTSQGDVAKIQKAKHTILYAVIGLIIVILAFAIVNFIINKTT